MACHPGTPRDDRPALHLLLALKIVDGRLCYCKYVCCAKGTTHGLFIWANHACYGVLLGAWNLWEYYYEKPHFSFGFLLLPQTSTYFGRSYCFLGCGSAAGSLISPWFCCRLWSACFQFWAKLSFSLTILNVGKHLGTPLPKSIRQSSVLHVRQSSGRSQIVINI